MLTLGNLVTFKLLFVVSNKFSGEQLLVGFSYIDWFIGRHNQILITLIGLLVGNTNTNYIASKVLTFNLYIQKKASLSFTCWTGELSAIEN